MKRITAWAAVLTLTLSLLTGCAQIDESSISFTRESIFETI